MADILDGKTILSAEDLGPIFLNHDNSKNLTLSSELPALCKEEPCFLGVDEAGRGPVLGPMVYGICYCPLSKSDSLVELGCADSKILTEEKRETIFEKLCKSGEFVGWMVEAIAPSVISNCMLRRCKHSLNQVAQDSTVGLIQKALDSGVNVTEVYVDTVGMPEKYQAVLSEIFPGLNITVAKKADSTYPIVSAASICAKVSRDRALQVWTFREAVVVPDKGYGSGYPNDPETKTFLSQGIDPVFGFPQMVRFSWSTASNLLEEKAALVEWEDLEEETPPANTVITSFFQKISQKDKQVKHRFFVERGLSNLTSL